MNKMIIAEASLTLYAYHLRSDVGQGADKPSEDANQLWERLVKLGQILQIPALQNLKQELICYQNGQYDPTAENLLTLKWQSLLRPKKDDLDCDPITLTENTDVRLSSFYPFLLHDTYAVDLTLSCNHAISLDELGQLNPKGLLLPKSIGASLGQTLLLYGEVPLDSNEKLRTLANDCVGHLVGHQIKLQLNAEGMLIGNRIFEYNSQETEPSKQCHILVWFINPDALIDEYLGQVSEHLLQLCCAYHKILYAYDQCQWCFHQAEELYSELEQYIEHFQEVGANSLEQRLEEFKYLLTKLPMKSITYSKYLRDLADHKTTIATNIKNYESSFKKLPKLPDDNLSFLEEFIELTHIKYQAQIQVYRQHLEPGAKLFEQLIDTVSGIVSIDRAELEAQKAERERVNEVKTQEREKAAQKREKRLELVITLVGTGLAVSSISASVISNPSEKFPLILQNSISSFLFDALFHLIVGIVFAIFMGVILWVMRRLSRRASSS
jgi:hypothetical protein